MRPDEADYRIWQLQQELDERGDPREPMPGWDAVCADHERMSAEIERLRAALRPFVAAANPLTTDVPEDVLTTLIVTCGDVVRARAALGEEVEGCMGG